MSGVILISAPIHHSCNFEPYSYRLKHHLHLQFKISPYILYFKLLSPVTVLTIFATFKVEKGPKKHFSHPVIANGTMYIRHGKSLMAYDIQRK